MEPQYSPKQEDEFPLQIEDLQALFDPKDLAALHSLGGVEGLQQALRSDVKTGLNKDGVEDINSRKEYFGENRLPEQPPQTFLSLVWIALHDKTLIVLSVAAVISLAVGLFLELRPNKTSTEPHWVEGLAIIISILIVVLVQAVNDYRKEAQFRKLNSKKEDRLVKCLRSGQVQMLSVFDIVVGDILLLEPGDVMNVDGILISGHNVRCDESSATGESDIIRKAPYAENADDIDPFILGGGKITEGVGQFLVTCVGEFSYSGKVMMSLRVPSEDTPLQIKLDELAENIAKIAVSVSLLLLLILVIKYIIQQSTTGWDEGPVVFENFIKIFVLSVLIIVVAVPEGLPLAVTIALAYGIIKMMKDNNLVRVLSACETMGNATTVCSDKTGTLTQNRMTVVAGFIGCKTEFKNDSGIAKLKKKLNEKEEDVLDTKYRQVQSQPFSGPQYVNLLIDSVVMNSNAFEEVDQKGAKSFVGNKTESALLEFCVKMGLHDYTSYKAATDKSVFQVYPFSSERKSMSTVVKINDDTVRFYVKGASEIVLKYASQIMVLEDNASVQYKVVSFTDSLRAQMLGKISSFADESLRTILVAFKDMPMSEYIDIVGAKNVGKEVPAEAAEQLEEMCHHDLAVILLVGIEDPLREGVPEAVKRCQKAGVFVRMVTGDNVHTATAIAKKCGIYTAGGVIMEGPQFRNLPDKEMKEMLPRLQVLARSSPGDKQILVGKLKEMGETVAVTGDGTNDAPALKMADVGFSMGITGTEVSKEASDIILMDDNFTSILKAMMWGRSVNDSVRKFIQFQMTISISAVTIVFVSAIASPNNQSALSAIQLLWINMLIGSIAALTLATDRPTEDILDRFPDSKNDPLITVEMWKMILGQSAYCITSCLILFFVGPAVFRLDVSQRYDQYQLGALVYNVFLFEILFNQFNSRRIDGSYNVFKGILKNKFYIPLLFLIVGAQVLIIYYGGEVFHTVPITNAMWVVSLICGLLVFPIAAIIRFLPTGDGCKICGFNFGMKEEPRAALLNLPPSQQLFYEQSQSKRRLSLFKAIHRDLDLSRQSRDSDSVHSLPRGSRKQSHNVRTKDRKSSNLAAHAHHHDDDPQSVALRSLRSQLNEQGGSTGDVHHHNQNHSHTANRRGLFVANVIFSGIDGIQTVPKSKNTDPKTRYEYGFPLICFAYTFAFNKSDTELALSIWPNDEASGWEFCVYTPEVGGFYQITAEPIHKNGNLMINSTQCYPVETQFLSFAPAGNPPKAMYNTLGSNGMKTPKVVYTNTVYAVKTVSLMNLYFHPFNDQQTLKVQFSSMVNEMKQAEDGRDFVVGFDCEWEYLKDSGNQGKIGKVSVLQLCFPGSKVLIIQLCHLKQIPTILSLFMRDASIKKVGRKVGDDARLLMQDYNQVVESVEDLAKIAKDKCLISSAKVSLRTLTQQFLGFELDKDEGVRVSKWSARKLIELQITYAARDVIASLLIYETVVSGQQQFSQPSIMNEIDSEVQSPQTELTDCASFPVVGDGCSRVKLDAWHAMKRICIPRHHAFQYEFCSQLRDAIFVVNQEDANDVARVLNQKGLNYDDVLYSKPDYILQRVRRLIPPAPVLVERLRHVLMEFSQEKYTDPDSGKPLLDSVAKEEFAKLLIHAGRGCLSDPQGISLYYEKGKDKDGLTLYRCIRGSSSVEGAVHQKLAMKLQPWNAGPKYADLAAAVLRNRYNVRASQRNRPGFPTIGHYDHDLIDKIQDITQKIYGLSVHDWWTPINQLKLHGESFGILPVVSTDQQVNVCVSDPRIEKYTESMKYLAVKMKTLIPHLPIQSVEEIKCFNVSVSKYMRGTFKQIDHKLFADDWNAGRLKAKPDGIAITCKLPEHLESYYKTFLKALTRKNAISFHSLSLQMVKHQLSATVALDYHFPAVGESKQLYPDRMITLLANPVAEELDEQLDLDAIVDDEEPAVVEQSSSLTVRQVGFVSNEVVPQMGGQTDLTPTVTDSGQQKNLRLDKKCKNCGLRISQGCTGGTRSKCVLEGGPVPKQ
ncbi:hypothetical protein MIR68_005482 [Amoeboaphelidium protococcarum]|nr:hypothetical protein MIR68_005482 [Amoeboaphelidium protococcarum]